MRTTPWLHSSCDGGSLHLLPVTHSVSAPRSAVGGEYLVEARVSALATVAGVVASALLLVLSFAPAGPGELAWFALVPLLLVVRGCGFKRAFGIGWLAGAVFFAVAGFWLVGLLSTHTRLSPVMACAVLALGSAVLGMYWGIFCALVCRLPSTGLSTPVVAASVWVCAEWLRGWFPVALPWLHLGASQHAWLPVLQISDLTGVYGVSALLVMANTSIAVMVSSRSFATVLRHVLFLLLIGIVVAAYGWWRLDAVAAIPLDGTLRVALLQGNVDERLKWDPAYGEEILTDYARRSRSLVGEQLDLVIWPETAVPFYFQDPGHRRATVVELARRLRAGLLFGSPAWQRSGASIVQLNRSYLLSDEGAEIGHYDKVALVPFGEYVPFWFGLGLVGRVVSGKHPMASGPESKVLDLGGARLGVPICYEALLPEITRRFVSNGARLLINLTNDSWLGDSAAVEQHFYQTKVRAIENRVPVVRVANGGISAVVGADGRVVWRARDRRPTWHVSEVGWSGAGSFYSRFGNVFVFLCMCVAVGNWARYLRGPRMYVG